MYGKDFDSVSLTVDLVEFTKVYTEVGESALVDINYDDMAEKALIKEVQVNPVTSTPIHVSFYKVNLKEKITAEVPLEVIGEETNPLLKSGEGMLLMLMQSIEVECLPMGLPPEFVVDVSKITEVGVGITLGQLNYDREKVEITGEMDDDELVLKIDHAEMQEEVDEAVDEAAAIAGVEATQEVNPEDTAEDSETTS